MSTGRTYWVYILASDIGGTLRVGVTNDLVRRVYEHRTDAIAGFSRRYAIHRLVITNNSIKLNSQFDARSV